MKDKTKIDLATGFQELERTHLIVDMNFNHGKEYSDAAYFGWWKNRNARYGKIHLGFKNITEKSEVYLKTVMGHEIGHIFKGMQTEKEKLDQIIEEYKDIPYVSKVASWQDLKPYSGYDYTSSQGMRRNWQDEYDSDSMAIILNPEYADMKAVFKEKREQEKNAGKSCHEEMLQKNEIKIKPVIAPSLGNFELMKKNMRVNPHPVMESPVFKFQDNFRIDLDWTHPPDRARIARGQRLAEDLKAFEAMRSQENQRISIN